MNPKGGKKTALLRGRRIGVYPGQYYDQETGLHYNYFRYYNPQTGRYITPDPIGLEGGINLFAYTGNNPTNLIDVYGLWVGVDDLVFAGGGALVGLAGQGLADLVSRSWSGWERYTASAVGGAAGGETLLYTANPFLAGAIGGATTNLVAQGLERLSNKRRCFSWGSLAADTAIGTVTGFMPGTGKLAPGITSGRGSYVAVAKQMNTKLASGQIQNVSARTATKMMVGQFADKGMMPGAGAAGAAGIPISGYFDDCICK